MKINFFEVFILSNKRYIFLLQAQSKQREREYTQASTELYAMKREVEELHTKVSKHRIVCHEEGGRGITY